MNRRNVWKVAGIAGVTVAAGAAVAMAPAFASPAVPTVSPQVLTAMQRDLGLNAEQATARLAQEAATRSIGTAAKAAAGQAYGGSWFDAASGKLVVAVTDASKTAAVQATGAWTSMVKNTAAGLDATKAALDTRAGKAAPKAITGWYVDTKSNSVVVQVMRGAQGADVDSFLGFAKSAGPVRVEPTSQAPRVLGGNIVGGDAYYINNAARCSIGFSVSGGFVSAGHCGSAGDSVTGSDNSAMGTFAGSQFPGSGDYSYVQTNSSWNPTPTVDGYGNPNVTVAGSSEAAVGQSVCRSGSTSGWHCGTIQATNQTVNYQEGTVTGLTQTNACAEPGDSGGSWVSGNQAQGMTSGGSGDCTSGGETFFQPVNEALSAFGVSLVTG
jgi:streptogrisin C